MASWDLARLLTIKIGRVFYLLLSSSRSYIRTDRLRRVGFKVALLLGKLVSLLVVTVVVASAFSYVYPVSGLIAGFVSVAVGSMLLSEENSVWALVTLIVLLLMLAPVGAVPVTLVDPYLLPGGIVAYLLLRRVTWNRKNALLWLVIVFTVWACFVTANWQNAAQFMEEPVGSGWGFDPIASLKMFYLMKRGTDYYEAYLTAVALNAGLDPSQVLSPSSVAFRGMSFFNWRGPLLFYMWMLLPSATALYGAYLALTSVAVACSYLVFSKSSRRTGLLAATIVMPYLTLGASGHSLDKYWWIEWEFWGALFSLFAFTLYARGHRTVAVIPAFFAAACKELLIGAFLGGFAGSAVRHNRRELVFWGLGIAAYSVYTAWHYQILRSYLKVTFEVSSWVGHGGRAFVEETFRFAFPWLWIGWMGSLIGLSVFGVISIRPLELSAYSFASTLLPLAGFMMIGQKWDAYWGVVYAPFLLLTAAYGTAVLHKMSFQERGATTSLQSIRFSCHPMREMP